MGTDADDRDHDRLRAGHPRLEHVVFVILGVVLTMGVFWRLYTVFLG